MAAKYEKNAEVLIQTASDLFKEYGYNNVTVSQICKAAHIARSSFYSTFKDKDDLVIYMFTMQLTKSEPLMSAFVTRENDFERIWLLYEYYIDLAIRMGYTLCGTLMIIDLSRNIGIYDHMLQARQWSLPLCENCQKQGIIRNTTPPEDLMPMVTCALNNMVYEWSRLKGEYPLRENARKTVECLLDVAPEYRWNA